MSSTQTYPVIGMTCDHCVAAVSSEIGDLSGVTDVSIELVPGGTSTVAVTSEHPLAYVDVAAAVDEAGYVLT
jgi:copper chaperone CopZ